MNESSRTWVEADVVITGAWELLTCARTGAATGARSTLGRIDGGAVAVREGRVVWVGKTRDMQEEVRLVRVGQELDVGGPGAHGRIGGMPCPSGLGV